MGGASVPALHLGAESPCSSQLWARRCVPAPGDSTGCPRACLAVTPVLPSLCRSPLLRSRLRPSSRCTGCERRELPQDLRRVGALLL